MRLQQEGPEVTDPKAEPVEPDNEPAEDTEAEVPDVQEDEVNE